VRGEEREAKAERYIVNEWQGVPFRCHLEEPSLALGTPLRRNKSRGEREGRFFQNDNCEVNESTSNPSRSQREVHAKKTQLSGKTNYQQEE
jgi:hypothetical protein